MRLGYAVTPLTQKPSVLSTFRRTLSRESPATAASETESFLPSDRAAMERWLKEVLRASSRFTTMLINYKEQNITSFSETFYFVLIFKMLY